MSPSSLESQITEHTDQSEMHDHNQQGNLALSSADFAALEDRISRTITVLKSERQARAAAEQRANELDSQLNEQRDLAQTLQEEIRALNSERDQVRQRVEKLLSQLDSLEI
jgi:hypothetical protein